MDERQVWTGFAIEAAGELADRANAVREALEQGTPLGELVTAWEAAAAGYKGLADALWPVIFPSFMSVEEEVA